MRASHRALFIFLFSIVCGASFFPACQKIQLKATGEDDEIIVFADSAFWQALAPALSRAFERYVFTPQPEPMFHLMYKPLEDFENLRRSKNFLMVGPIDGGGEVSAFLRSALHPDVQKIIREGKEFVINKYNVEAKGQTMMFLSSNDAASLETKIDRRADELFYYFENAWLKREIAELYSEEKYAKKELERSWMKRYEWNIFIQHDYHVAIDSASEKFVWLRRVAPADMERWIFVHWIDDADPSKLTSTFCFNLRNELTRKFLHTVEESVYVRIADDPASLQAYTVGEVNFLGRFGYEMRGLWQFSDKSGGGPFMSTVFYDEPSKRIYIIDGSVWAPRYAKKKLLMQLRAIMQTFRTANDLTDEERKELKD